MSYGNLRSINKPIIMCPGMIFYRTNLHAYGPIEPRVDRTLAGPGSGSLGVILDYQWCNQPELEP
jgi:hypothetical protein